MKATQFLIDTSAPARFMHIDADQYGWDQAAAAGLIDTCPITELEFFFSARSAEHRARGIDDMWMVFGWAPVDDRVQVQEPWPSEGNIAMQGPSTWWWLPRQNYKG